MLLGNASDPTGGLSHDEATSLDYLLVCVCIVIVLLTAHASHLLHLSWLSETGAIIVLGIVIGGLFRLIDYANEDSAHHFSFIETVKFQHDIFLNVILPLIILEAGYSLKHSGIVRNLGAVLMLAVPGTLISTLIIGGIVYGWSGWSMTELNDAPGGLMLCFTFGALLSATDPVSVIALLSSQFDLSREPPLLYNLIFGESVLNDAVAIVLFDVFIAYIKQPLSGSSVILAILNFAKIFCLSSLIGYIVGLLCALLFRFINFHDVHHIEVSLLALFCAASYYLCDLLDLSGIMGLFICSRTCGHLATYNMSRTARETAPFVFKTLAAISECAVFFLLGTAIWAYDANFNPGMIIGVIVACLVSRLFVVLPFCFLSNLKRNIEVITPKMQFFMWYSGLRGAIAFGLVVILHDKSQSGELGGAIPPEVTSVLLTACLCTILFTVLFMGAGAGSLLRYLELHKPVDDEVLASRLKAQEILRQLEEPLPELRGLGWFLRRLEKRFIEDIVKRKPPTEEEWALLQKDGGGSRYASHHHHHSKRKSRRSRNANKSSRQDSGTDMTMSQRNLLSATEQNNSGENTNKNGGYGGVSGVVDYTEDMTEEESARFFLTRRTHNEWGSTASKPHRVSVQQRQIMEGGGDQQRFGSSIQPIGGRRSTVTFNNSENNDKRGDSLASPPSPSSPNMSTGNLSSQQQQREFLSASAVHPNGNGSSNTSSNNASQQGSGGHLAVMTSTRRRSSNNHRHSHHHHSSSGWQDAVRESRRSAARHQQQPQVPTTTTGSVGATNNNNTNNQTQQQQDDNYSSSSSGSGSSSDDEFAEYNPQKRPYEFSRMF